MKIKKRNRQKKQTLHQNNYNYTIFILVTKSSSRCLCWPQFTLHSSHAFEDLSARLCSLRANGLKKNRAIRADDTANLCTLFRDRAHRRSVIVHMCLGHERQPREVVHEHHDRQKALDKIQHDKIDRLISVETKIATVKSGGAT